MDTITPRKSKKEVSQTTELIFHHPPDNPLPNKKVKVSTGWGKYVIILLGMGVMAVIALHNLVGCGGQSRSSDGKLYLGVINRAQQSFHSENGAFASNLADLDLDHLTQEKGESTKYYRFAMETTPSGIYALAIPNDPMEDGIKSFSSTVQFDKKSKSYSTVLCVSNQIVEKPDSPIIEQGILTCPNSMVQIN